MTPHLSIARPVVEKGTLIELFRMMTKIRFAEQRIAQIYPLDKIQSPIHLSIGQEAVSAGICHALERADHIYGTYRGHGVYLAKGGDLKRLFAELYGKATGCTGGKGGSMHLVAPEVGLMGASAIVASTIPIATGDALASAMKGRTRVTVSLFGDGAVDEGVFFESINFAVLKELPIIYVCENNHYAVHSKVSDRHKQTELFKIGEGLGLTGTRLDGNDVTIVYSGMRQACQHIRKGGGPLLLEFMTYRWYEHVGPGMDHGEAYRDQEKLAEALRNDPVEKAKSLLKTEFGVSEETIGQWEGNIHREVEEAIRFAESSPFPGPESLYKDVYGS